jgi:thioredoxin reductase (NADPH)
VDSVTLQSEGGTDRLHANQVFLMTGFTPHTALLQQLGVTVDATTGIPAHDPTTMETGVDRVFIAGVLAAGFDANKVFIENGRGHGELIARRLAAGHPVAEPR